MSQDGKISIIVPVYNGGEYINETLKSCVSQGYDNYEVLIVDDSSSDNGCDIIERFIYDNKDTFPSIRFLKNDINLGLAKTVNLAVQESLGEFVLILGHDDILLKDHLSTMIKCFDIPDVILASCNACVINQSGELTGQFVSNSEKLRKRTEVHTLAISQSNFICSCGLLMRRKEFLSVGGWDERFRNYGEWLLWIKLSNKGRFAFSLTKTAHYRVHSTNISQTFKRESVKLELSQYFTHCKSSAVKYHNNWVSILKIKLFHLIQPIYSFIFSKGLFK